MTSCMLVMVIEKAPEPSAEKAVFSLTAVPVVGSPLISTLTLVPTQAADLSANRTVGRVYTRLAA